VISELPSLFSSSFLPLCKPQRPLRLFVIFLLPLPPRKTPPLFPPPKTSPPPPTSK
jgi:hypothetical protein